MKSESSESSEIIIYEMTRQSAVVEVRTDGDTVWLTQQQIATLFDSARTNIVEHIKNIYEEKELFAIATCRNFRQVQTEGKRRVSRELPFYNLDMILSVGYRVNSKRAMQFRRWATTVLKQHLIQGYTINASRLKQLNQVVGIISRSASPEIAGIYIHAARAQMIDARETHLDARTVRLADLHLLLMAFLQRITVTVPPATVATSGKNFKKFYSLLDRRRALHTLPPPSN